MEETGIIYMWTCIPINKSYIGQTIRPKGRYRDHLKSIGIDYIGHNKLGIARAQYSNKEDWKYTVLEDNISRNDLNKREVYWIDYYNTCEDGLNGTTGGNQKTKYSESTRKAISEANRNRTLSITTRKKISESVSESIKGENNPFYNHHHSEISKNKISNSKKGTKRVYNDPNDHSKGFKMIKV